MANKFRKTINKKRMKCNSPRPLRRGEPGFAKKKRVVKACSGGKEKIIKYGAKGYKHNYSDSAKKSFRARHKCDQKKSKTSASYWACKDLWPRGKKTTNPKAKKGRYRR
tara:strand:+ start:2231 stop:2557 length:327 start_codon:yes stop_codon:yes gene_type:complete